ncbi:hypothetical protein G6F55_014369 [Rhizopus delemar]|nr:hypothetical protein G6F55_014369 [Rhizopus delemar]KAG1487410.1 hypothetical protein G6F52_014194 [Rhizopus delemar]
MQSGYSTVSGPVTLRQGGVTLVDLRAAYRVDRHVTVALNLNNVFDKKYYASTNVYSNYYGAPFSAMLGVNYKY